jgi:hypothetical protein
MEKYCSLSGKARLKWSPHIVIVFIEIINEFKIEGQEWNEHTKRVMLDKYFLTSFSYTCV